MPQISAFRTIAHSCLLLAVYSTAHADFDAKYKAYSGDLDGNGYSDLFLSRAPDLVMIPYDDLTIPIATRRAEYVVLMQNANRTFTVNSAPSAGNVATMKTWAPSPVQLTARDLNVDGQQDVFIKNFAADPRFPAGTTDQIVYAAGGAAAATAVSVTPAMRDFFTQIHGWILNRDYFINTAINNDWYHYNGNMATGWWFIEYIDIYYAYSNGTKRFLDDTDDPDDVDNVPVYCQDFPSYCRFYSGAWQVYGTYQENIQVVIEYQHFNQDALRFAQAAGTAYDVPASAADPTQAEAILEANLHVQTGRTVADVLRYPIPRPDLPPEVTPEPPMRPIPPNFPGPANDPTFYPEPQLKWKILGKVTIWACVLFCIDKGPEDENEIMDWRHFGYEWALWDILHRDDPSSQVRVVIGEAEGIENVYTRIPSAAVAWGAIYFSFGVDPETGRQAPFSSEPTPWSDSYLKFMWEMNSAWLEILMGKQAQFYDIQLYARRPPPRGIFYPCERKILLNYPLREERAWQETMAFAGGACRFF